MWAAVICGLLVSPICYFGVKLIKGKLKSMNALDAFGCHGIGGIWGGIATGLFGMTSINGVAQMEWTCLWRDKIICGTDHRNFCIYRSCSCRKFDLHCDRSYLYSTSSGRRAEKIGLDVSEHGENAYPSFNGLD